MQFRDLKRQYIALKNEIDQGIQEVIESTSFISGKHVEILENELADYVGVKHCITCANGTDALSIALMAWDVKEGDCVFVPDFTFFASGEVVSFEGATPIFVDVDRKTFNLDPQKLEKAIQKVISLGTLNPKVIVAVDLFGRPADYKAIRKIADKYNLKVLEDAAQGFGGEINGQKACSFGDISTTSFFPAKPLGCYGDGGAIFTNDDEAAKYMRSICVHGKGESKYDNVRIGCNSRLDTIQAAILLPKLHAFIDYELEAVNDVAKKYTEQLRDWVIVPEYNDKYVSSWAQYSIVLKSEEERNSLQNYLKEQGIPTMIYYQKAMHKQLAFDDLAVDESDFDVTNQLCKTILALPMHPYLQDVEIEKITETIKEFLSKTANNN